jgi:hypothetical protein
MTSSSAAITRADTQVVVKNLRFRFGLTGAPGSAPGGGSMPISLKVRLPSGSTANSVVHQMVR